MSLPALPNEILLRIAWFLPQCATCDCRHLTHDLSALSRSSQQLHCTLAPELTRYASADRILLWAIWHNRLDTVIVALTHGADVTEHIVESQYVGSLIYRVGYGTPLEIAIRNRLRPHDPEGSKLALEICEVLLAAGGTMRIDVTDSIVEAGDAELFRCCIPYIDDINERTSRRGITLLAFADSEGQTEIAEIIRAAGGVMDVPGQYRPFMRMVGVIRMIPMDGRPSDFRIAYPGWEGTTPGDWDEWGPVSMLPSVRSGCLCPWCPREITGGYSVMRADDRNEF